MRLAVLPQLYDQAVPPIQSSIGLCCWSLAHALGARGHDVALVVGPQRLDDGDAGSRSDLVELRVVAEGRGDRIGRFVGWKINGLGSRLHRPFTPPESTSPLFGPQLARSIAAATAAWEPDAVIVAHSTQLVPHVRRACPRAAVVFWLHHELFSQTPERWIRRRLAAADVVATSSLHVERSLVRRLPELEGRVRRLPNGIDPAEAERTAHAGWTEGPPTILSVGAVTPHKGTHRLVEAFVRIADRHPDARLDIVGRFGTHPLNEVVDRTDRERIASLRPWFDGDYAERLRAIVPPAMAGRVRLLGPIPRDELRTRLSAATVVAFPSIGDEGFGLPPLEALAFGAAVLCTDAGALVENLRDGIDAVVVRRDDAGALADGLDRLLSDPHLRHRLSVTGRAHVLEHVTWAQSADAALACLTGAASLAH